MISKAKVSFIKSLQVKKYRQAEQSFLVQGAKAVLETLASDHQTTMVVGTSAFLNSIRAPRNVVQIEVTEKELTRLGSVESNDSALAVVRMKKQELNGLPQDDFSLLLEDIRDPGNLGTIIRTADWFGIRNIVASPETADVYNPKVINSSMGSFLRVNFFYADLSDVIRNSNLPSFGTFLTGESIHSIDFGKRGLIVIGNESRGISPAIEKTIKHRVTIPGSGRAESLNASVATAIVLDNLRRS